MKVSQLQFVLLFVKSPEESGKFYSRLFGMDPIEQSPTFVLFKMHNGMHIGLWSQYTAKPEVIAQPGGSEICFVEDKVEEIYESWCKLGVSIAQEPVAMDGMKSTFVALDPDGHRIRVLSFEENAHD